MWFFEDLWFMVGIRPVFVPYLDNLVRCRSSVNVNGFGGIFRPHFVKGVLFGLFQHGGYLTRNDFGCQGTKKERPEGRSGA
jgi:hypothetical protein